MPSRADLVTGTIALCAAFSTGADIPTLLSTFTTSPTPCIYEHGLSSLAPFLGRTFSGQDGLTRYFNLLSEKLGVEGMDLDGEKDWIVDTENAVVCLKGKARFVSKATGQGWNEVFIYKISLAEEEGDGEGKDGWKVRVYEVWADTGAAYLAARGELDGLS